ncbi:unnamed protein product [Microthlaspi erraticum]|uniref:CCHC-type domain-containing protein n=1 Tax=Microthlaspi erraticum TaxID=1685480 RepID=A0A6D2JKL6_9BRAS|nr:unnamed protein product [Microthlaspi erraticum]
MPNLTSLEFEALDISGDNYLAWALDAEIHLSAKELGETIKEGNKAESKDKAKAMIFLRHHLHEGLKSEYLNVKDPQVLWTSLKERYDHQKTVILPRARYDWTHLRLQDFKSVSEYNSALFKITSKLELCGEKVTDADMLEKTFSTFHANNVVLQTQYREKGFQKYSQLISCLLVAEQNNELLMKNHGKNKTTDGQGHIRGRGRGGRGRGYGRGRGRDFGVRQRGSFKNARSHQNQENKGGNKQVTQGNACYRCGGNDHWARLCRTPKHLVGLYQQAVKEKGKNVETNLVYEDGEATHMEIADILAPEGNMRI